ncbi:hypothetical protein [Rhodococcus sp. RD6.2]|jgi:hypothetical protein|uniref:hypothetical protein n=1 Tax=Rhodococcus sp. RD6.2 TaxID=260936 RepID=UPI000679AAC0|nr:hypothetical protein [Rhodococcus sp. RD6.2]
MSRVWVPGIVGTALRDADYCAALGEPPPAPNHAHGSEVAGCTTFPAHWTQEVIERHTEDTIMFGGWRDLELSRIYYRDCDGVWVHVLTHRTPSIGDNEWGEEVMASFPQPGWPGVGQNPGRSAGLEPLVRQLIAALKREPDSRIRTLAILGTTLWESGRAADAVAWLIDSVAAWNVSVPEDVFTALYILALRGDFAGSRCEHPTFVSQVWAEQYPATWGLPPGTVGYTVDLYPGPGPTPPPDAIVRRAREFLDELLPELTPTSRAGLVEAEFVLGQDGSVTVTVDDPRRVFLVPQQDPYQAVRRRTSGAGIEAELGRVDFWSLLVLYCPVGGLAAMALVAALAELCGTVSVIHERRSDAPPQLLTAQTTARIENLCHVDALRRMVVVDSYLDSEPRE